MKRIAFSIITIAVLSLLAVGCAKKNNAMNNPFFSEWDTPYGIPDFQKIKPEHYLPAMKEGMKLQKAEINEIVKSKEAPTFENTIVAYERSGAMLDRVTMVFFNLMESNNSDELEAIANEAMPLLTAHGDDIALNAGLFERVAQVYSQRDTLGLEPEDMRLLEETYKSFVRNGANVPQEQQQRFRDINTQIASLSLRFGNNVLKASNEYRLVLDENQLDGLTPAQIEAAREAADESDDTKGKYVITLHNPSLLPFLTNSTNRELRQQIWEAYSQRCTSGKYDNRQIIDSLVNLRLERAKILGFDNHAAYVLDDCMAKTPQAVYDCLNQLWTPALNKAKAECREYEQMLRADGYDALQPWDWRYYSEKLRKQRYALDDDTIRQYLPLERVRQGAFDVATKLYGITFRENGSLPNYDPEATAYEVLDGDTVIAILYMDFFPRASKRSGAWMTNFREQYVDSKGNNVIPIIQIVCNFSKPSGGKPALLDFDEAETLFHEFGHSLHGMLSRCHYKSLSGTNVPRDFVELPSQVMENWCRHPQVIKEYARHYATGEPMPNKLIDKIIAAQTYGQGFVNTELLAASLLDMDYHTINEPRHIELPQFEDDDMARIGLIPQIISRYRSTYFQHIFSGGYSAGYYSYTWTAILDADAFEAFRESGDLYNPVLARKFRHILESGNTSDLMELYRQFRGKDPSVQPLLRNRGLI